MVLCVLSVLTMPQKNNPATKMNPIAQGNKAVGFSVAERESVT